MGLLICWTQRVGTGEGDLPHTNIPLPLNHPIVVDDLLHTGKIERRRGFTVFSVGAAIATALRAIVKTCDMTTFTGLYKSKGSE